MTLQEARRRAGCSEAALERLARVPSGTIENIESHTSSHVGHTVAVRIASALCVDIDLIDELKRVTVRPGPPDAHPGH